jgi:hypothetical protein
MMLRPSPWKWLMVTLGGLGFVIGEVFVMSHDASGASWTDWATIVFFGLVAIVGLINLIPGASYLRLDAQGFEMRSLYRGHTTAWSDVTGVGIMQVGTRKLVGWNFIAGYERQSRLRKINTSIAGFEAALPDTYGMSAQALADLMESIRVKQQGRAD